MLTRFKRLALFPVTLNLEWGDIVHATGRLDPYYLACANGDPKQAIVELTRALGHRDMWIPPRKAFTRALQNPLSSIPELVVRFRETMQSTLERMQHLQGHEIADDSDEPLNFTELFEQSLAAAEAQ